MAPARLTLLLVEDNAGDARLLREMLRESDLDLAACIHKERLAEAIDHLRSERVDCVLLDLSLPDSRGEETLARALEAAGDVPVIVLTGFSGEEHAVEAVQKGAQDYLVKGEVGPRLLGRSIRYARERKRREIEERRTREALSLLRRLTLGIGVASDTDEALGHLVAELCRFTGWAAGESWLPSEDRTHLERRGFHASDGSALRRLGEAGEAVTFGPGEGVPGVVWKTREPFWQFTAVDEPAFPRAREAAEANLTVRIGIPVLAEDEVVAVLLFFHGDPRPEEARLIHFAVTVAAQMGSILQRKRAEEALRRSETRLRHLMDIATEGIWVIDADGRTQYVNERMAEIMGRPWAEFRGRPVLDFIHEQDREAASNRLLARLQGVRQKEEVSLMRPDGSTVWLLTSSTPVASEGDDPGGSLVMATDITELKRREAADRLLADAGRHFTASLRVEGTMDRITHLLVPGLADWCVIEVLEAGDRPGVTKLAAAAPEKERLLRQRLELFPYHEGKPDHPVARALQSGETVLIPTMTLQLIEGVARNEEHLDILRRLQPGATVIVPLFAEEEVIGTITLTNSESGRTFSPHEVALVEELARRAELAIQNATLYERARRAVLSRDRVLGYVAHDLRNPLAAISLNACMLAEERSDDQRTEMADAVLHSIEHMNRLVEDLLDVARLDAGELKLTPAPLRVTALFAEARDALWASAAERNLTLEIEVAHPDLCVKGDKQRVLQILSNLLANAARFSPPGGTVELRAKGEGELVRISVADWGPGIPQEEIPRLFDRYWQGAGEGRGSAGLGLAITRGLVEAQGGTITVQSEVGVGTTFSFTMPAPPSQMAGAQEGSTRARRGAGEHQV
jgi:PAS domain S-box-containing protein